MADFDIKGIDVSKHQGSYVDFERVYDQGFKFSIVKATEGTDFQDKLFFSNWEKLLKLDGEMYRGAYHFARPDSVGGASDGAAEAKDFAAALKAAGGYSKGCLPPTLDFEKYSESDASDNVPWIEAFVKTIEDELGRTPMIYTGANIWKYEVGNSDAFTDLPLWLVYYTSADRPSKPMNSLPWEDFTFWQFSGGGDYAHHPPVEGIGKDGAAMVIDVNYFNGTDSDLAGLAMMGDESVPNPPQDHDLLVASLKRAEEDVADGLTKIRCIRQYLEREA